MIGSFVTCGVGGRSTVALFVTEGFGATGAAPAPISVVLGGIPKRRRGRYEIEINGQRFVASSVPALEAMVARWRKANPANDAKPPPKPRVSPPRTGIPAAAPDSATAPRSHPLLAPISSVGLVSTEAGGALPQLVPTQSELLAASAAFAGEQAQRATAEAAERARALAAAQAAAQEDADLEALLMILLEAA